ncbi:MAG: DNRLRE domain-containing protein [Anaerolineales bacterium]
MHTSRFAPRFVRSSLIALAGLLLLVTPALAYFIPSNDQAATLVLGQPTFTSTTWGTAQNRLDFPEGVAVDPVTGKVFVADFYNSRVLRFASAPALSNGAPAEAVLGQPNFTSSAHQATQSGMYDPMGVFVDAGGRLWVADWANHRVLRFDHAATLPNGAKANGVLGQPNFTAHTAGASQHSLDYPSDVFLDAGGRLWVVDDNNSRVLRFDHAATLPNGAKANGVLGQPNFTSSAINTTQNGMWYPDSAAVDANGSLWVSDYVNNRVLRFDNAAAKPNGANADGVLGQPNFVSNGSAAIPTGMDRPTGVRLDNATGRLYVADYDNSRILVFDSAAGLAYGAAASYVLGQTDFFTGTANTGGLSATSLWSPSGLFYDQAAKVLWVTDTDNNRVLMFGMPNRLLTSTSIASEDGWVLESAAGSGVGGSFSTAGTLRVGDDAANRRYRSILSFDTSALPDDAVIQSATLKIRKAGKTGTDPLATNIFGSLYTDIKSGSFGTPTLEADDWEYSLATYQVGTFSSTGNGWYSLVLPPSDYAYINLTGLTHFRLHFNSSSNYNHKADYDSFFAGDASGPDRPVLTIEYTLP